MAAPKLTPAILASPSTGSPMTTRIGKYEVGAEMQGDPVVEILQGFDRDTGRPVTLKVLTELADPALRERFRREVATAARLHHSALIAIYELGDHAGRPFAAMQHLAGISLEQAIEARRPESLLGKMQIMGQVAEGIRAAHLGGIPYLGIRPSDIVLSANDTATIQDFGTVRPGDDDRDAYMAPEELSGAAEADALCDLFVFGVVYYELIAGRHPFLREDAGGQTIDIAGGTPAPLRHFAPECPEELERILSRTIEKRPEARYQSLEDVRFDLAPILRVQKRERAMVLLADVEKLVQEESPDQAQRLLRDALELDSEAPGARELVQRIEKLRRRQAEEAERRARLTVELEQADRLMAERRFNEASYLLERLLVEFPAEAPVRALAEEVRAEVSRVAAVARALERCDELRVEGNLDEALEVLNSALTAYPGEPELIAACREIAGRKEAIRVAVAVRAILKEVRRRLDKGRPDLAAQFLKERLPEFPDDPSLLARLAEIERDLPEWQQQRLENESLNRAALLEEKQQWAVALTILEEALKACPESEKLAAAVHRFQEKRQEEERRQKLARRLKAIRQKTSAQAWPAALALVEAAQRDFPDEPELQQLTEEILAGIRRSEYEAIEAQIRQYLADGEVEQAQQVLRKALDSHPSETALQAFEAEVEAAREFQLAWHEAQVLFGRARLKEAEELLLKIAGPGRPQVDALLEAVAAALAAAERENLLAEERERTPAIPVAAAAPPLLAVVPPVAQAALEPAASSATTQPPERPERKFRAGWLVAATLLVTTMLVGWVFLRRPPERPAATPPVVIQAPAASQTPTVAAAVTPPPQTATPVIQEQAAIIVKPRAPRVVDPAPAEPLRRYVPTTQPAATASPATLPLPPGTPANHVGVNADLPTALGPSDAPAPPKNPDVPHKQAPTPAVSHGLEPAELLSRRMPQLSEFARTRGIFGLVKLEATIDQAGNVTSVKVLSGDPILAASAKNTVIGWKYKPARLNGQAIPSSVTIQVNFQRPY